MSDTIVVNQTISEVVVVRSDGGLDLLEVVRQGEAGPPNNLSTISGHGVTLTNIQDGDVLTFDAASDNFVNQSLEALTDIQDLSILFENRLV